MKKFLWFTCLTLLAHAAISQSFEISALPEAFRGSIGETIKAPVHFKNITDKPLTLIIRKVSQQIGGTQKNYFCLDNNCYDHKIDDLIIRLEAGQTYELFQVGMETGLAPGLSVIKYTATNRSNTTESLEFDLNFTVEEKSIKENIYSSHYITLYNVYPNPVTDHAFVEYKVANENVKAKIVLHNILGTPIEEYPLPPLENKVKIKAELLNAGIYFYTLYLDTEGLITRKLVVKK